METQHNNISFEMNLYNLIHDDHHLYLEALDRKEQILAQLQAIKNRLADLPEGGFSCRVNGDHYKCYRVQECTNTAAANALIDQDHQNLMTDQDYPKKSAAESAPADQNHQKSAPADQDHHKRVTHRYEYLPKTETPLIRQLALRKLLELRMEDLSNELKTIEAYLGRFQRGCCRAERYYASAGISELVNPMIEESRQQIVDWQNASYEKSDYRPEDLTVPTLGGFNVRSKSEALIADVLIERGIPFRYENVQLIGQRKYSPDFTILHPATSGIIIWEHFGMMDSSTYQSEYWTKMSRYMNNGYLPYVNLITTFETRENPFDIHNANRIVKMMFDR